MKSGIYIISSPSGKRYLGSAVDIAKRWRSHRHALNHAKHHNNALQRAWVKYEGALDFSVLVRCAPEHLLHYEQICIDGLLPEYNTCQVAGSPFGRRHTEETKDKISDKLVGRVRTPEHIARQVEALRGKKHTTKTKAKMSAAGRARWGHTASLSSGWARFDFVNRLT